MSWSSLWLALPLLSEHGPNHSFSKSHPFLKASPDLSRLYTPWGQRLDQWSLADGCEKGWIPEMTLNGTCRCLLSLCCFVGGVEGVLRVILHLQTWEAKLQLVLVVDDLGSRRAGRRRGVIWEPACLGWVTHQELLEDGYTGQQKGRKQKSRRELGCSLWERLLEQPGHPSPASSCSWDPGSHESLWGEKRTAGPVRVCAPPSRDLQISESKQVSTSREAGQDCKSGESNSLQLVWTGSRITNT